MGWPQRGAISFCDYSTRYRPGLELVVRNINAEIAPTEKVGIVGRTGAGKNFKNDQDSRMVFSIRQEFIDVGALPHD